MTPPTDSLEAALRAVLCRCGLPWDSLCHDDPLCIGHHVFSADSSALAAAAWEWIQSQMPTASREADWQNVPATADEVYNLALADVARRLGL